MSQENGEIPKWVVIELDDAEEVEAYPVRGKTPQSAFRTLPAAIRQHLEAKKYRVEPFPERLQVRSRFALRFEIPGVGGEDRYTAEVHEWHLGVGFQYMPIPETATSVERLAPPTDVQQLAQVVSRIFEELRLQPRRLVLGVKEDPGIGLTGYEGRAIVGQDRSVYIELEAAESRPLAMLDFWEGILWHEAMHVRYVFEKRWPTMWPWYDPRTIGPILAFDLLVHFSIDGWLERHNKPTVFAPPADEPDADSKATRLWEFRQFASREGYHIDEDTLRKVAESLWGQETDICEVWKMMHVLGLAIRADTPLGRYLEAKCHMS